MSVAIGLSFSGNAVAQSTFSKTANPTSGVAPLTVLYTYTFDNTRGRQAVSVATPSDRPQCSPVVFRGGDTNGNQMADVGEIWTWTCTTVVNTTTTNTAFTSARFATCDDDTCTNNLLDFINASATVTIPVLAVSISGRTQACKDDLVTLTAVPTGGAPPYIFLWTTGATTQSITANTSMAATFNFGVSVRDALGGTASANARLSVAAVCLTEVTPGPPPEFPLLTHDRVAMPLVFRRSLFVSDDRSNLRGRPVHHQPDSAGT
jgi:hypothetical protein